jgi:hypothetical protein
MEHGASFTFYFRLAHSIYDSLLFMVLNLVVIFAARVAASVIVIVKCYYYSLKITHHFLQFFIIF